MIKIPHSDFIEEWKANNDLFKYHEDLKQKRFSYFLSVQAAFMALIGVLGRSLLNDESPEWLILAVLSFFPFLIAKLFEKMDARARDYVDVVKGKLLLVEKNWKKDSPQEAFTTYTEQFEILVHNKIEVINKYVEVRNIGSEDRLHKIYSGQGSLAVHLTEGKLFLFFKGLWVFIFLVSIVLTVI